MRTLSAWPRSRSRPASDYFKRLGEFVQWRRRRRQRCVRVRACVRASERASANWSGPRAARAKTLTDTQNERVREQDRPRAKELFARGASIRRCSLLRAAGRSRARTPGKSYSGNTNQRMCAPAARLWVCACVQRAAFGDELEARRRRRRRRRGQSSAASLERSPVTSRPAASRQRVDCATFGTKR